MSFKIVEYSSPLFRAEKFKGVNQTRANQHYNASIPYHFFTTVKAEVEPYRKYGTTYTKTWRVTEPLVLIDIMDLPTRKLLEQYVDKSKLDIAFPIINNKVYRVSENETDMIDRAVLQALCSLRHNDGRPIDGYYMKRQEGNLPSPITTFHSEVGLCRRAFRKLMHESSEKMVRANRMNRVTKRVRNMNSNNNNTNTKPTVKGLSFNSPSPTKKSRLFNNNNNNNNRYSTPTKRKLF